MFLLQPAHKVFWKIKCIQPTITKGKTKGKRERRILIMSTGTPKKHVSTPSTYLEDRSPARILFRAYHSDFPNSIYEHRIMILLHVKWFLNLQRKWVPTIPIRNALRNLLANSQYFSTIHKVHQLSLVIPM